MRLLSNPHARILLFGGSIGLLQLFFNGPVLDFEWVYFDDDINILLNPHLTGNAWETGKWAWTDLSYTRRYMPLGWLLFDALWAAGGLNSAVYHLAGWLLAAGNTILLFLIVRKFCAGPPPSIFWPDVCAFATVVVLSLHPWRAETAGWSSGLLYLAGQFLAALAVLAAWQPVESVTKQVIAVVLYTLALLVYPVFLSLPLILILAETGRPGPGGGLGRWFAAIRFYGAWLAVALALGALNWFGAARSGQGFSATTNLGGYSLAERWTHFAALGSHYVGGLLLPGETSPFYGTASGLGPQALPRSATLVALAIALGFLAWSRTRGRAGLILGLLAASMLPFVGLLDQNQTANDRYTFLLLAVVTGLLARLLMQVPPGHQRTAVMSVAVLLAVLMFPAYRRSLSVWTDTDHLQARIDQITAPRPDARLAYARPAVTAYLLGHNEQAADRIAAGVARLGPHPEIMAAIKFIRQTSEQSAVQSGHESGVPPYALLHLELARNHRGDGRLRAAEAHELFAGRLLARQASAVVPGKAK